MGGLPYQYDANGNRTQVLDADGVTVLQSLAFNQRGLVDTVNTPAGAYAFAYDPLGYRIQRATAAQTNLYMLEGEHLEAIYSPGGQVQSSYHRGSLIDEIVNGFDYSSGTKTNFTVHHDHLNSITALTDHNGQAWQSYQYDPFGNPLNTAAPQVPNDFTYTGREWDGLSGLYYYRARYYDPEVGRFISEDPLGFEAGINFYAYVENRSLIFSDPTGRVILATAHYASVTSYGHMAHRIYPDDPVYASVRLSEMGQSLLYDPEKRRHYFTVSAGPDDAIWLTSKINSEGDAAPWGKAGLDIVGQVTHPGVSENHVIESMLSYHNAYNQDRELYDFNPFNDTSFTITDYNSGSYFVGISQALGLVMPSNYFSGKNGEYDMALGVGGTLWNLPGTQNPLPVPEAFGFPSENLSGAGFEVMMMPSWR